MGEGDPSPEPARPTANIRGRHLRGHQSVADLSMDTTSNHIPITRTDFDQRETTNWSAWSGICCPWN